MTTQTEQTDGAGVGTAQETLTVTDNRTGRRYEIPIEDGTIRATELRNIKTQEDDFGLMTYDPAYMATASCRSAITFIDGEKGILEYRATRSSNWQRSRTISRSPTCWCTVRSPASSSSTT